MGNPRPTIGRAGVTGERSNSDHVADRGGSSRGDSRDSRRPRNRRRPHSITGSPEEHETRRSRRRSESTKRYYCEYSMCTNHKGFARSSDLKRHLDTVHQLKNRYSCGCCEISRPLDVYGSQRKDHMKQHMHKSHLKDSELQLCKMEHSNGTIMAFAEVRCLYEHMRRHHYRPSDPNFQRIQCMSTCLSFEAHVDR